MENKNKWWKDLAKDMRVYFVILIIGLLAVVYFCGIRGNNQDNFYYVPRMPRLQEQTQQARRQ